MPPKSIFSKEEDNIIKNSVGEYSHSEIAKLINNKYGYEKFTAKQVKGRANNKGWYRENYYHTYNKQFFKQINSTEKAYWFGFIYADGYIINTPKTSEVSIQLSVSDKKHLEKFNKSIGGNVIVSEFLSKSSIIKTTGQIVRGTQICQIRLYSLDMANDLERLKLLQNKTYESVSPDLCYSDDLNIAIIRGFFDGDGCIDKRGECHFTAYSTVFLDKVNLFLNKKGIKTTLYKEREGKHRLYIHTTSVLEFLSMLYSDSSYSYLERKFILANKTIKKKQEKLMSKKARALQ